MLRNKLCYNTQIPRVINQVGGMIISYKVLGLLVCAYAQYKYIKAVRIWKFNIIEVRLSQLNKFDVNHNIFISNSVASMTNKSHDQA